MPERRFQSPSSRSVGTLPNNALQRIAAQWRMGMNLKGSIWAARGARER